jgi:DNA-binding beta-propeller fold protein YncE
MRLFTSWFQHQWSGFSRPAPRQTKHAKLRIRPLLEQLENRLAPAFLFVSNEDAGSGDITRFDTNGSPTVFATGLLSPAGLAFDSAGNLYVATGLQLGPNAIHKFSPAGVDLGNFATTGLHEPTGLAFDSAGNLYVANTDTSTIHKFSPTGVDLGDFATTGLRNPDSLAFDSAGNLYASNTNTLANTVHKFSPTGVDLGDFATTGLNQPLGIAFDSAGNLYVANGLERFTMALHTHTDHETSPEYR